MYNVRMSHVPLHHMYHSLTKELLWAEDQPYKSAKQGMGARLSVSAFSYGRASMSCLQQLDALKVNN